MKRQLTLLIAIFFLLTPNLSFSQVDGDRLGAWYMYFWNTTLGEGPWGFQGDMQYRNWNTFGDLEQLLLRGGLTYQPQGTTIKFTLGYGYISTGVFDSKSIASTESRIYQEALLPQKVGGRFYLRHRFRFEQRFVENQDFRTRWRYALFLSVPLNKADLGKGAIYLALYNELFINGERDIGKDRTVEVFDRNRLYGALGYSISDPVKVQLGYMQQTTNAWSKGQLQLSLHHKF